MFAQHTGSRRLRLPIAGAVVVAALAGGSGVAFAASGGPAPQAAPQSSTPWRHGEVPFRGEQAPPPGGVHAAPSSLTASASDMAFQGGTVGVTTGAPQVYLVFYGSQWGSQGTNANGYSTYSGDPSAMAPDIEAFLKGLGTGGELWSGVMTQYCQGVAVGTAFCPSGAAVVGYPTGGALAGVWEDTSVTAASSPTAGQLGQEAEKAAAHFGNTTAASNRNAQYFILSPHGTHPDGFNTPTGNFCAWHDYTGDSGYLGFISTSGSGGPVAFTNMPYVTDAGYSCGANFVNGGTAGLVDGVTIVGGHEYAETITDQFPSGGWVDSSGYETGDKCAWISSGQGAAADLTLTTGSFAVQSSWANDFNSGAGGCELSHPIVTATPPNTVKVGSVASQDTNKGAAVNPPVPVSATDSGNLSVTWSATGLPAGLSIGSTGSTTGAITGTPSTGGTYSVTVTASDSTGGSGSTSFTWTVNAVSVQNPGNQTTAPSTPVSLSMSATDTSPSGVLSWSAQNLPAGLSIDSSTGVISGTTGAAAPAVTVTVTATNSTTLASGSTQFTWTVAVPDVVKVSTVSNQSTKRYTSVSVTLSGSDSVGLPLQWTATGLPRGLSISSTGPTTAVISGTPTKLGTWTVTVTATDSSGAHGSTTFSWSIHS